MREPKHHALAILRVSAAIDIGVDHLAAITANKRGFVPRLVNGRPVKSTNQFYNKRRAELQAALGHPGTTKRLERLTTKRTRRINAYLHQASKAIIVLLVAEGIGTLVVGKNAGWKQEAELGRVNNQHFVRIPHTRFIQMLEYKAQLSGIRVLLRCERATPAVPPSWMEIRSPPLIPGGKTRTSWSGKRIKRGLYRARDGRRLTADVNGSDTILRKAVPDACGQGVEAPVVAPVWLMLARSVRPKAPAAA